MGLFVVAYKKLTKIEQPERDKDGDLVNWKQFIEIEQSTLDDTERDFKGWTQGVVAGVYAPGDALIFRVGSYLHYKRFREQLKRMASNSQCFELITFFDSEGIIGPILSKKLAKDFKDLEEIAKQQLEEEDLKLFLCFKNAFELASSDGYVEFM